MPRLFIGFEQNELVEGVMVNYLGVHPLRWGLPVDPTAGFRPFEDEQVKRLNEILSENPNMPIYDAVGQVLKEEKDE